MLSIANKMWLFSILSIEIIVDKQDFIKGNFGIYNRKLLQLNDFDQTHLEGSKKFKIDAFSTSQIVTLADTEELVELFSNRLLCELVIKLGPHFQLIECVENHTENKNNSI